MPLLRLLAVFALLLAGLARLAGMPPPGASAAGSADLDLDLAAMVPTPAELGAAGYQLAGGRTETLDDHAANVAAREHIPPAAVRAVLASFGFERLYLATYLLPVSAADASASRLVSVAIVQYATADGAEAALRDDLTPGVGAKIESLADPLLGDESGMQRRANVYLSGRRYQELLIAFRKGNLEAVAELYDRGGSAVALVRGLGLGHAFETALERGRGGPNLSGLVLRLPGSTAGIYIDNYDKLDGDSFRLPRESDSAFAIRVAQSTHAQDVYVFDAHPNRTVTFIGAALQFPSIDDASSYLRATSGLLRTAMSKRQVKIVAGAPTYGDESVVLAVTSAGVTTGYVAAVRVGTVMGLIEHFAPTASLKSMESLAAAQAACLQAGFCPDASLAAAAAIAPPASSPI